MKNHPVDISSTSPITSKLLLKARCPLMNFVQFTLFTEWPGIRGMSCRPIGVISGLHKDRRRFNTESCNV